MSRAARWAALATVLPVLACGGTRSDGGAAFHPLDVGAEVPSYRARTLPGDTVVVGGDEPPTVLNVWATWCTSCQEEMTALDSLHHEFGTRVRVVAVSVDEGGTDRVRRFAESNHLDFTVAHDPAGDIQQLYRLVGVPTTFVIGHDGRLLWRHTGNIADPRVFAEAEHAVAEAAGGRDEAASREPRAVSGSERLSVPLTANGQRLTTHSRLAARNSPLTSELNPHSPRKRPRQTERL